MISTLQKAYEAFLQNMHATCRQLKLDPGQIQLIAVSKYQSIDAIKTLYALGQRHFGENKLQEALAKQAQLKAFPDIKWHFLGHLQTNKVKKVAQSLDCIHSIDSLRLATALHHALIPLNKTMPIFLQVNLAEEPQKFGFSKKDLVSQYPDLLSLKQLAIKGLMIIPPFSENIESTRTWFRSLKTFQKDINQTFNENTSSLSMGMSKDWTLALEEGATHIRIGTQLFGARPKRP